MIECQISTNLLVQYILVALIITGTIVWIIVKIRNSRKRGAIGCCGCSMASSCPSCKPQAPSSNTLCHSCKPGACVSPSCCKEAKVKAEAEVAEAKAGSVVEPLGETPSPKN